MINDWINISTEQGNFLIRLFLAHLLSDFLFQTKKMVENKSWFSNQMTGHIIVVFILTFSFTFSWWIALIVALSHWLIDGVKLSLKKKYAQHELLLFLGDQFLHILILVILWLIHFKLTDSIIELFELSLANFKFNVYILSYAIVIWPVGYIIRFTLHKLSPEKDNAKFEHGGKLIGQFERIIILTFVLLNQYEAIGFLITGKSIIRFARSNEDVKSEYVLVGTMMSYAITILIGVLVNWII